MAGKEDHAQDVLAFLINDLCTDMAFQAHRNKACHPPEFCSLTNVSEENAMSDAFKYDIFGNLPMQNPPNTFECANCARPVAAQRYAPHLHKCMGNGRRATRSKGTDSSPPPLKPPNKKKRLLGPESSNSPPPGTKKNSRSQQTRCDTNRSVGWSKSRGIGVRKRPRPTVMCGAINQSSGKPCQNSINCQRHTQEQQKSAKESK